MGNLVSSGPWYQVRVLHVQDVRERYFTLVRWSWVSRLGEEVPYDQLLGHENAAIGYTGTRKTVYIAMI